jgi:hypothetical protein
MIDLKTGEMTFTLRWVAEFVGSPAHSVQRWAVRGWLECAEGGGRQRVQRYFNLRQVRQAYILGMLLRNTGAKHPSGWMNETKLREVLRRIPNRPPHEPLWLLIHRKNGVSVWRWLTESELEDVHSVGLSGGSSLLGIPSVHGV